MRRLVELHGGTVTAQSEGLNCGSTFLVKLPLWQAASLPQEAHASSTEAREDGIRRKILVVDDNRDSAMSLSLLLELDGHDVRRAYDGLEALEIAEDFRPEVMLLDIGMPRLDGYGAARELRRRDWAKAAVARRPHRLGPAGRQTHGPRSRLRSSHGQARRPRRLRQLLIEPRRLRSRGTLYPRRLALTREAANMSNNGSAYGRPAQHPNTSAHSGGPGHTLR